MSEKYDELLKRHHANVKKGYNWIKRSCPEILKDIPGVDYSWLIDFHDDTKTIPDEYEAYDNYIFGERTPKVEQTYKYAKLEHIHRNPHHWQHWVMLHEDAGVTIMEMPYEYIVEMVCDWWSFSWEKDSLFDIFDWYDAHKKKIKLHKRSRDNLEDILDKLHAAIVRVRGPRKRL